MISDLSIWAELVDFGRRLRVAMVSLEQLPNGDTRRLYGSVTWKESTDIILPDESCYSMSMTEAQRLIERLWDCGLRPTQGAGSAGQLSATQYHLEDMRKIAFNK